MKRALLCGVAGAMSLLSSAAFALEDPKPCSPADGRVRCIAITRDMIVRLVAAPGASLIVEIPDGERVIGVLASDNALMRGPARSVRLAADDGQDGPEDRPQVEGNLFAAARGTSVVVKPYGQLVPQPLFILTERDGQQQRYRFQIETGPDWIYSVRLRNTAAEAADQRARWAAIQQRQQEQAARDKLAQEQAAPCASIPNVNRRYVGQGDAALAPVEVCDDGRSTYLRFPGRIPVINATLPNGDLGAVNVTQGKNGWVTVQGTAATLQLSDGGSKLCLHDRAYSAAIANTGTGTVSASVVREAK
jgi:type IV secretory pathway VirB9-like protein